MTRARNQTLADHIEALRAMLLRCAAAMAVAFPLGLAVAWPGVRWLARWLFPPGFQGLYYNRLADPFILKIKFALIVALVVSCPFVLWEIWKFVAPGLREREQRAVSLHYV